MKKQFGFVKIKSGTHKGRIARYIGHDEKGKAQITFSYDQDFLTWPISSQVSQNVLDDDISLIEIIDRYYDVVGDLNKISLKGHPKIKKYSAKHNELICESHLLRCLLKEYTAIHQLQFKEKETNIYMMSSFQDLLLVNDLIAELSFNHWHVCHNDHEIHHGYQLEQALYMCSQFVFVLSQHYDKKDMYQEYQEILAKKNDLQQVIIIALDQEIHINEDDLYIDRKSDSDTLRRKVIELEKRFINYDSH